MLKEEISKICFYNPAAEYGWLSNFSMHPIKINGVFYKTVEHYFHAQKFPQKEYFELVLNSKTPEEAFKIAKIYKPIRRKDWKDVKEQIMYEGIKAKFSQYPDLKGKLLSTGKKEIIEESDTDFFWGSGKDGTGKNKVGKILMQIRSELNSRDNL